METNIYKFDISILPQIAKTLKAVAHPLRLQILERLAQKECSVLELVEYLKQPQAIVSQHLRVMRSSSVVTYRRKGSKVIYSLAHNGLQQLLNCLLTCQSYCLNSEHQT